MTTPSYLYAIGSTSTTTNVEQLTTPLPPPKSTYHGGADEIDLGNGAVRLAGWVNVEWHWGFLTRSQRDQLRTFCTGASATVFIRTRTNDTADSYAYLTGQMIWPSLAEERDAGRRIDFTIRFRNLVVFTP